MMVKLRQDYQRALKKDKQRYACLKASFNTIRPKDELEKYFIKLKPEESDEESKPSGVKFTTYDAAELKPKKNE